MSGAIPRTIREAVWLEMAKGPAGTFDDRVCLAIKDRLAQMFGARYLSETNPEVLKVLYKLWDDIEDSIYHRKSGSD